MKYNINNQIKSGAGMLAGLLVTIPIMLGNPNYAMSKYILDNNYKTSRDFESKTQEVLVGFYKKDKLEEKLVSNVDLPIDFINYLGKMS